MQQAYRALRVVSEAQTIRMVLSTQPDELVLKELITACTRSPVGMVHQEASDGIKAIVLDFKPLVAVDSTEQLAEPAAPLVELTCSAVQTLAPPVLAVVRGTLSPAASALAHAADLTLAAHNALLTITDPECQHDQLIGEQAARLGYVTWSASSGDMDREMARILDMLREKSALALRHAKTSVRLGIESGGGQKNPCENNVPVKSQMIEPRENVEKSGGNGATPSPSPSLAPKAEQRQESLKQVNAFYLDSVMQTEDAHEGLHAFLEKRKAQWKNR